MAIRLVEVEIAEPLPMITGLSGYSELWALLRAEGFPLGWVRMQTPGDSVRPERLCEEIADQLGEAIAKRELCERLHCPEHDPQDTYRPFISVLICTRDRADSLLNTLDSLLDLDYPNYEVVVVDNAPSDERTKRLACDYPFRYVVEPHPGHSWARNRAISEARGEIVAFLDDDMLADDRWLTATARGFADPEVGYVTGLVLPLELETEAQELFEVVYGGFSRGFGERRVPAEGPWQCGLQGLCHDTAPFMAFRREVFAKAGIFDTAFGGALGGAEDTDLLHRVIRAGFTLAYRPDAIRYHRHRETFAGLKRQLHGYGRSYLGLLTKCFINEPELRRKLVRQFIGYYKYWCVLRIARRLLGREKMPMSVILAEITGALSGPWAYLKYRKRCSAEESPVVGSSEGVMESAVRE